MALYYQRRASEQNPHLPRDLAYLEGKGFDDYLHDMKLIQQFAQLNRKAMVDEIVQGFELEYDMDLTTIHNYIDLDSMILRKGAISAKRGEVVLIPMNMRDGSLLCEGLGNRDWNESAPHGASRVMSRTQARKTLSLRTLHQLMDGALPARSAATPWTRAPKPISPCKAAGPDRGDGRGSPPPETCLQLQGKSDLVGDLRGF